MKYFKLPDLGEGLPEADILEWHIKEGDLVKEDQLLVSVETAKAVIEVPSPQTGVIAHLFGAEGDTVHTGEPLVEFITDDEDDSGTVVGTLARADNTSQEDNFIIGASPSSLAHRQQRATPAVRALAKRLDIDIDTIKATGHQGGVSVSDIEQAARLNQQFGAPERLKGVRKHMAKNMSQAHADVAAVSIFDDANISHWVAKTDITMQLILAIAAACKQEPIMNSWFDGQQLTIRQHQHIDLGVAVDTDKGLFVPVLRDIAGRSESALREGLNKLRTDVAARTIPAKELQGATITLTNFGTMAGRYATPIVVPPQIGIIGAGVIRDEAVVQTGTIVIGRILPISLTFDHRVATGGEAARFLKVVIATLEDN
ncbi:dihydrolipoamide acetyltransferase family protein [Neptunomonas antarctica]|uniref:Dihydrolipoamide acetyltransferase component of pyruvate dehydrogenase complex n=1 Tax=Neptunomonas antarctica TaxID=619304 RepID=A0A1N7MZ20_9GAMM|nr:dihydrolipoamide acetyltransferase family protein [Neptunomonas antarctica]SIS91357.1 pyruvate dehydrogenase E2 component (dihydrolipoamide acetyltransferase) [Neptunomonas antarctica]